MNNANYTAIRGVIFGSNLWLYLNDKAVMFATVPLWSGSPGIGGNDSVNHFHQIWLGVHDTTVPSPVDPSTFRFSVSPDNAAIQWQGASENSTGTGVMEYNVYLGTSLYKTVAGAEFDDETVQPSSTYSYAITAVDYHGNESAQTPISLQTPDAGYIDARRVGVRATGAYWGGGGEQIDLLSGNLNFSIPLLTMQQGSGATIPLALRYNSQNWRQEGGANWQLSADTGCGFGWRLAIGSLVPFWKDFWTLDHYIFIDGSGAEYRLSTNNNGVWSSSEGQYVYYDSNANRLYFSDGTWWLMGSTSSGAEFDAGTLYPTVIEDVHGNRTSITYLPGSGLTSNNTSSRIWYIADARAVNGWLNQTTTGHATYVFTWNSDAPVPHVTSIANWIGTAETYNLTYLGGAMEPSFGADSEWAGQTTTYLASLNIPTLNSYNFAWSAANDGTLTQVTFPYGGHLRWSYAPFQYAGNRTLEEVNGRYLAADSTGATEWSYGISHDDSANPNPTIHATGIVADASGAGAKRFTFALPASVAAWETGLLTDVKHTAGASPGAQVYKEDAFIWSQDPAGNPYISSTTTTLDPGTANAQAYEQDQTLDQYGNTLQLVQYPYNSSTPARTYTNTYLTDPAYVSLYILNRLLTTSVTASGVTTQIVKNYYDGKNCDGQVLTGCPSNLAGFAEYSSTVDTPYAAPAQMQGLVTTSTTPALTTNYTYWDTGVVYKRTGSDGKTITSGSGAFATAPSSLTTESYSATFTYNAWLGLTQATGANGEQMSMQYDGAGRPSKGISPYGGATTYAYSAAGALPATQTRTGGDGVTKTTLDGLGRVIRVERGDSNGTKSIVDTVYEPCACSPLGKIQEVSAPYAPGATQINWTVYTYDGLGRTLAVQQPDGASTTGYSYAGNATTVTDPAKNRKTTINDPFGNIVEVDEPDPASGSGGILATTYSYDWMNHLTQVTMTRGTITQTRTYGYDAAGRLASATNPENGAVTYTYNADNTLQKKHDAKGQDVVYAYDSTTKHITMVQYFPQGQSNSEDQCQRITYGYSAGGWSWNGTNYTVAEYVPTGYSNERLTWISVGPLNGSANVSCPGIPQISTQGNTQPNYPGIQQLYGYDAAGGLSATATCVGSMEYCLFMKRSSDSYGRLASHSFALGAANLYENQPVFSCLSRTYDTMGALHR